MVTTADVISLIISGLALVGSIISLWHTFSARGRLRIDTRWLFTTDGYVGCQLVIVNHGRRDATLLSIDSRNANDAGSTPLKPGETLAGELLPPNPHLPMRLAPFDAVTVVVTTSGAPAHEVDVEWQVGRKVSTKRITHDPSEGPPEQFYSARA